MDIEAAGFTYEEKRRVGSVRRAALSLKKSERTRNMLPKAAFEAWRMMMPSVETAMSGVFPSSARRKKGELDRASLAAATAAGVCCALWCGIEWVLFGRRCVEGSVVD